MRVLYIDDMTVDAYFAKSESIATLLTDLGSLIHDDGLVTYVIHGLSDCFSYLSSIIAHRYLFPDLERLGQWSLVGALQYLTFTRHDLSYAVQQVCLYMHDHREPHLATLKRFLRYICGTLDYGLHMYSSSNSSLVAYSHVDWAGCLNTRRFTLRYCVFLGNNLLSWSSKRQYTLSRSSSEAGYRGVAKAVVETFWLRNFLRELHSPLHSASIVYYDNASADMYAFCMFTKGLPSTLFDAFQTNLSVLRPPAPTAERWAVPIKEGEVHLGSV
ncbi:ribonuclease H-like domain-containing protein [Tanacetum coccineum]